MTELIEVIVQLGGETVWALAVGPSLGVHLQQTQIHTELDFLDAILADKSPHTYLARLVIPLAKEVGNIEIHATNMDL